MIGLGGFGALPEVKGGLKKILPPLIREVLLGVEQRILEIWCCMSWEIDETNLGNYTFFGATLLVFTIDSLFFSLLVIGLPSRSCPMVLKFCLGKNSAGFDGGLSRGSIVHSPGSKDSHRHQRNWTIYFIFAFGQNYKFVLVYTVKVF